jgi:hypothetical protein
MDVCAVCPRRDEMPQNATVRKITGESFCKDSVSILTCVTGMVRSQIQPPTDLGGGWTTYWQH